MGSTSAFLCPKAVLIESAFKILFVEDRPGDVLLTREAFNDATVHINFHVASDGVGPRGNAFLGEFLKHSAKRGLRNYSPHGAKYVDPI